MAGSTLDLTRRFYAEGRAALRLVAEGWKRMEDCDD